ncbi:MAG: TIR domain-containing protein [Alistipes sp.]|nr:TIR domain-containing protein [Alistipes sp.]
MDSQNRYDVFISCKSEDYALAREIHDFLTSKNYSVFLADADLRKEGRARYGKVIDEALESAIHLVLFASKPSYVVSTYVEEEWRIFLEEQRSGRKSGNLLTVRKGFDKAELPISLRSTQSFTFEEYESIIDFLPIERKAESAIKPTPHPKPLPQSTPKSSHTYKVGDYYDDGKKQGVVFEVTPDGKHGKIVSLTESSEIRWASDENEQKRLIGAVDEYNGASNMAKVRYIDDWRKKYPTFAWCAAWGEGWYLPAIEELKKFTLDDAVHDAVNRTLASKGQKLANKGEEHWYLSSTDCYDTEYGCLMCEVGMDYGVAGLNYKDGIGYVRAVSAF